MIVSWPGAGRAALTSVSCSFNLKVWRPSRNTSGYAGTCRNMRAVTAAGARRGQVNGEKLTSQSCFISARDHCPSRLMLSVPAGAQLILRPVAGKSVMAQSIDFILIVRG